MFEGRLPATLQDRAPHIVEMPNGMQTWEFDGNFYAHVWPGNSLTGDHSTRGGTTCPVPPNSSQQVYCPFVLSNTTFRSRSSLTSYGPHSLFSVPNNDGSTSTNRSCCVTSSRRDRWPSTASA